MPRKQNPRRLAYQAKIRETLANLFEEERITQEDTSKNQAQTTISPLKQTFVLPLTMFPQVQHVPRKISPRYICRYLFSLIQHQDVGSGSCLKLPSMLSLALHFNVAPTDIREAFVMLREYGLESQIPGLYGSITIWLPGNYRRMETETVQALFKEAYLEKWMQS